MSDRTCRVCGHDKLIPGRRRDKEDAFSTTQEAWIPGHPEIDDLGWFQGAKEAVSVVTYACPKCGALQSYVDPHAIPHNMQA